MKLFEERLNRPFEALIVVALIGDDAARLKDRADSAEAHFRHRFDTGWSGLSPGRWEFSNRPFLPLLESPSDPSWLLISCPELAAIYHPPSEQVRVPGVSFLKRPELALPWRLLQARGLLLGSHRQRGRDLAVHLPYDDLHAGHLVIPSGRTGVGKTTFLHRLQDQLFEAPGRPSLVLLDPHGDLALALAARSIPPGREGDVVLWELGDDQFPIGLPLFRPPAGVPTEVFVQTTFATLRLIFREQWSATRLEDCVFALTATLAQLPDATLLDVPRLFGEPIFRRRSVARLTDPAAVEFWAAYEGLSEAARQELIRPVLYRLRKLYRSPALRNVVCRTDGLELGPLADRGTILLVSLAGASIGAEADLLGELILARLHLELLARLSRPSDGRRRTYLVVDESQRYHGSSLRVLLSEGRKLAVTLLLATQYLAGWGESLAESVLGNVGTLVCFRAGPSDSRRLAQGLRPFTAEQLEDLDRFEAVVKLQIDGQTMPAFDIRTLPIEAPIDEAALGRIRARTRKAYARPRHEVEEGLEREHRSRPEEVCDIDEE